MTDIYGLLLIESFVFSFGIILIGLLAYKFWRDFKKLLCKYNILLIDYELLRRKKSKSGGNDDR